MTLQQFIEKYNGEYLEVAGSASAVNQCVDLANGYIREVLGLPIIEWTNARDFPIKAGNNFSYIKNTPEGVPSEGDLVIWGNTTAGHIAIFIEGSVNRFRSFDQNYPSGSPCRVVEHGYSGVIGWLHPISNNNTQMIDEYSGLDLTNIESMRITSHVWKDVQDGKYIALKDIQAMQRYEAELNAEIKTLKSDITTLRDALKPLTPNPTPEEVSRAIEELTRPKETPPVETPEPIIIEKGLEVFSNSQLLTELITRLLGRRLA